MNIFILDENKSLCAQYHNDKHIVKMPTETGQILSTALYNVGQLPAPWITPSHRNHGCVRWAGESMQNFLWLCELGLCLCDEYSYRFTPPNSTPKSHAAKSVILHCQGLVFLCKDRFPDQKKLTPFYLAIPANCICIAHKDFFENTVLSYRYYYCKAKQHLAKWTKRSIPTWYKSQLV